MKKELYDDLRELIRTGGELDCLAERGYKYEDMYDDGYIKYLSELCGKYNVDFNKEEIDWEWCNYIQGKQYELEVKLKRMLDI